MPGIAGTYILDKVLTVYQAISYADFFSAEEDPGVTIFGLINNPSSRSLCSMRLYITYLKTLSDASAQTSMEWSPSVKISGSMIGTKPFS